MQNLIKHLAKIQRELKAPKNQRNTFGNYNYRNAEDILEAVKPLLGDDYILTINDEILCIGNSNYIKSVVTLSDGENSISASGFAREAVSQKGMNDAQITGSTSSYAKKYALNGLFCIDDTKDADHNSQYQATVDIPEVTTSNYPASEKQVKFVRDLVQQKWNVDDFRKKFNVMSASELSSSQAKEAIEYIQLQTFQVPIKGEE